MLWVWVNFLIELIIAFQNWLLVETRHWPAICASKVPDLTHVHFIHFHPILTRGSFCWPFSWHMSWQWFSLSSSTGSWVLAGNCRVLLRWSWLERRHGIWAGQGLTRDGEPERWSLEKKHSWNADWWFEYVSMTFKVLVLELKLFLSSILAWEKYSYPKSTVKTCKVLASAMIFGHLRKPTL